MYKIYLILAILIIPIFDYSQAIAKVRIDPVVMSNILYKKTNHDALEYVNEYENLQDFNYYLTSLNLGIVGEFDKLHITLTTNRFFNNTTERKVRHKASQLIFTNKEELVNDTLGIGYLSKNRFNTAIIFANVHTDNTLVRNNIIISKSKANDLVKGVSFGKYINDKTLISLTYFEGSNKLNIDYALSFNVFYSFAI